MTLTRFHKVVAVGLVAALATVFLIAAASVGQTTQPTTQPAPPAPKKPIVFQAFTGYTGAPVAPGAKIAICNGRLTPAQAVKNARDAQALLVYDFEPGYGHTAEQVRTALAETRRLAPELAVGNYGTPGNAYHDLAPLVDFAVVESYFLGDWTGATPNKDLAGWKAAIQKRIDAAREAVPGRPVYSILCPHKQGVGYGWDHLDAKWLVRVSDWLHEPGRVDGCIWWGGHEFATVGGQSVYRLKPFVASDLHWDLIAEAAK